MLFRIPIWLALLGLLASPALTPQSAPSEPPVNPDRLLSHVKYLASDDMRGRGAATPQLDRAAEYIRDNLRAAGLDAPGGDYFQKFDVATRARLGKNNRMTYSLDGQTTALELKRDFIPLKLSGRERVTAPVVFAGYGISAGEYGYDDYAGIDPRGKAVLILRHEPQEYDRKSVFAGRIYTEHSQLFAKVSNARRQGAAAVILVNDTEQHGGSAGDLTSFDEFPGPAGDGIPFVHLNAGVAQKWFAAAGRDFIATQRALNEQLKPASFAFPETLEISLRTDVQRRLRPVRNVIAYLPGDTSEYVIVGAHYDHIGEGEQYSMAPSSSRTIHPGADDNASGVAGMIELARWFASRPRMRRGVLFLAFAAEELGLVGSGYYVRNPRLPLENAMAMINLDMIGRMRDEKVYVGGAPSGAGLSRLVEESGAEHGLDLDLSETVGYGSSDHATFMAREVPSLFFFSGLHGDYHRPGDTWEKIKPVETARLLRHIADVVQRLSTTPDRVDFVRSANPVHGTH